MRLSGISCPPALRAETKRAFLLRLERAEQEIVACAQIAGELDETELGVDLFEVAASVRVQRTDLARRSP